MNLERKRQFRSEMTPAERMLWLKLRGKQFQNLKFRRQHGVGPYIVDFYCPEKSVVIEVDGDVHADEKKQEQDKQREEYLKKLGVKIIRYFNNDIFKNIEGVLEDLIGKTTSTSPNPSLQRRGI